MDFRVRHFLLEWISRKLIGCFCFACTIYVSKNEHRLYPRTSYSNSELYDRNVIRSTKRISNPGCYATSTQLLIAPLVNYLKPEAPPTVFGVSGYSGAGTIVHRDVLGKSVTKAKVTPELLRNAVKPYSITGHIHEREASYHLSSLLPDAQVKVGFIPVVGPWFSGILSTASIPLKEKLTAKDVVSLFEEKYADEKLIRIQKGIIEIKDVQGNHDWRVGGFQMSEDGGRVVVVVGFGSIIRCFSDAFYPSGRAR